MVCFVHGWKAPPPAVSNSSHHLRRAYDYDPNKEAQASQQAAPVAQTEEDAPKLPQHVSKLLRLSMCSCTLLAWQSLFTCPPVALGMSQHEACIQCLEASA